ncbi:MAG: hypothetical protein H6942_11505 [Candidatus Accumulibacter sp.]|uniref:hypothetical protein n=1 Tax=Accumulibacter sp. TaxID=2053492 RepID=UPI001E128F60|nr:hypothetical protein [Accumulibacter sp.]MCB1943313.1 hypothetical protein [Accumulibacter sp.]MCP5249138.1 hypothetical protein [Accumulibacter sp.]
MIQRSKHFISLLFSAGLVVALGGCSTLEKHIPAIGALTPETSGSAAAAGVYYAASPDLPLHRSPGGIIVKRLPQYTKLHRDQVDKGFAHVRVESTGETGWVENAQLTWRPPTHGSPQQAPAPASQPAAAPLPQAVEASPQAVEAPESRPPQAVEAPPPSPSPSSAPAKGTVAPSIFNPY